MRRTLVPALIALAALVAVGAARSSPQAAAKDPKIERGRYLVHQVAMCVQCHSPRDENGELIPERLLRGEAIPFSSPFPTQRWAFRAPAIAGLPGYSKADGVRLLTTGVAPSGHSPMPPMPPFRMTKEDAEAVVEYLASIG
jgi:mono/diheme cytochrome c family protein